jgi:hypothetical protein
MEHVMSDSQKPAELPRILEPARAGTGTGRRVVLLETDRDNFSPHLSAGKDKRVGQWAAASNADHATHREQNSMIRRYIAWRNRHTADPRLRRIVKRATAA